MIDNTCRHCSQPVLADALGILIDASGGDVCDVSGGNDPHALIETAVCNTDINGIEWLVTPEHVEWLRDNGTTVFEHEDALALMLLNDVVFLNGLCHRYHSEPFSPDEPSEVSGLVSIHVICSDVFAWGCADAENLPYREIENLYRFWRKDPNWGPAVWCMVRRNQMPQKPAEEIIAAQGIWNLADFHLGPNTMDAQAHEFLRTAVAQVNATQTAGEQIASVNPLPSDLC